MTTQTILPVGEKQTLELAVEGLTEWHRNEYGYGVLDGCPFFNNYEFVCQVCNAIQDLNKRIAWFPQGPLPAIEIIHPRMIRRK